MMLLNVSTKRPNIMERTLECNESMTLSKSLAMRKQPSLLPSLFNEILFNEQDVVRLIIEDFGIHDVIVLVIIEKQKLGVLSIRHRGRRR